MAEHNCVCGHPMFGHDDGRAECFTSGCKCRTARAADDYTPPTDEIIRKYATGATWQHQSYSAAEAEIRRWLAAHDAEVRSHAQAVAAMSAYDDGFEAGRAAALAEGTEEPEWEYGVRAIDDDIAPIVSRMPTLESAQIRADNIYGGWIVVRRRKAGPWEPIEPEGETVATHPA